MEQTIIFKYEFMTLKPLKWINVRPTLQTLNYSYKEGTMSIYQLPLVKATH